MVYDIFSHSHTEPQVALGEIRWDELFIYIYICLSLGIYSHWYCLFGTVYFRFWSVSSSPSLSSNFQETIQIGKSESINRLSSISFGKKQQHVLQKPWFGRRPTCVGTHLEYCINRLCSTLGRCDYS